MPAASPLRSSRFITSATAITAVSLLACRDEQPEQSLPPAPVTTVSPAADPPKEPEKRVFAPARAGCDVVPVFVAGEQAGSVCAEDAGKDGLTVIDLSDTWTPRVFTQGDAGEAPQYRAKYIELARQPNADLGLHGIQPNLSVLASRLTDEKRRSCDAAIDLASIGKDPKSKEAISAMQSELACAGLMKKGAVTGRTSATTHAALDAFRRRHMIVGAGVDAETVSALALGGDELAFRGLLRGLRERVAGASGLIEDGSASNQETLVQGRELDLSRFAPAGDPLPNGAPDLVDAATDVAARELGWTSPEAARVFLAGRGAEGVKDLRVAVTLPKAPAYHSAAMDLRVEIDRGDVYYEMPGAAAAARKKRGSVRGPSFVVYAKDGAREVPLMRWGTTIGGWKKERMEDGELAYKYKESDVGERVWRRIIAAPAWMPPDSTPESDLLREDKDGNVTLKSDLVQPGYRNAYGLVMIIHDEEIDRGAKTTWADRGIRTHGSVDYRSIKNGSSHGCHRLYNQLALRLSGFLLDHRAHARRGKMHAGYHRTLEWKDQTVELDIPTRGYLYELDPPVPVRVLEGNVAGEAQTPVSAVIPIAPEEATSG